MAIADDRGNNNDSHDPILAKVASTNTIESDWPTLRHHLHVALLSTLPLFLSIGPPRPYRPPLSPPALVGASSPIKPDEDLPVQEDDDEGEKPPSESLLLSPSQPVSQLENTTPIGATSRPSVTPRSVDVEPTNSPNRARLDSISADDTQPSTPGGLVIPPFPPLDRNRRRRSSATSGSAQQAGPPSAGPSPRVNGLGAAQHLRNAAMGVFEDEWDEDVAIGGKKMPGWMEEDEGKKELDRLAKTLEEMEVAPFTVQRLAELLLEPTQYHKTLGKFLRAVEKSLLVTSPWEPPSYTATSGGGLIGGRSAIAGSASSASSASSDNGYDTDSTMPPGASTPMFVPIPFAVSQSDTDLDGVHELNGEHQQRTLDDGLMSPLMLSGDAENGFRFAPAPNVRSPTPEPEDAEMDEATLASTADTGATEKEEIERPMTAQGEYTVEHSDPAHQSYLGRVDELDTGPLPLSPQQSTSQSSQSSPSNGKKNGHGHEGEIAGVPGTGEGGTMAPHGMSDKPVPISSTTVLNEDKERAIANLPRSVSDKSLSDRFVAATANEDTKEEVQ